MRLREIPDGWHADGVRRRDFRHDPSAVSEIDRSKVKKKLKPRKKIDHKHIWVEVSPEPMTRQVRNWYLEYRPWFIDWEGIPSRWVEFRCSLCPARMHKTNMRYGYEHYKWSRNRKNRAA